MAENLKHDNTSGDLVYNTTTGNLVYECGGCCDYTVTVTNCPALNGSYDVTFGVPYDAGGVEIDFTEPNTIIFGGAADVTILGDRSGGDCPDQQNWAYEDGDCPGITVTVECT